jgi:hypothetical protein
MRGKWESPSINGVVCSAIRVKDTPEEKERPKWEKLCGYCPLSSFAGGIASDTFLCPFVIAKEAAKAQGKARH